MSGADTSHRDYVGLLYRTHHAWLQARLRRYPGSSSYAEDIAADTFTQLLTAGQGMSIREPRALFDHHCPTFDFISAGAAEMWNRRI